LLTDLSSTNGAPKTQSSKALAKLDRQRGTFAGELPAGTRVPPEGARLERDGIVIVEENGREKSDTKRYNQNWSTWHCVHCTSGTRLSLCRLSIGDYMRFGFCPWIYRLEEPLICINAADWSFNSLPGIRYHWKSLP